jgi:hypothetical protein
VEVHGCKGMGENAAAAAVPVDRPYDYFSLESLLV